MESLIVGSGSVYKPQPRDLNRKITDADMVAALCQLHPELSSSKITVSIPTFPFEVFNSPFSAINEVL